MEKLDKKLGNIVYELNVEPENVDEHVKSIKQAFIEAEWIPPTASAGFRESYNIMRGQEWYARFGSELEKDSDYRLNDAGSVTWDSGDVMRAAKKASGIKE